jgi:hypothetical protein
VNLFQLGDFTLSSGAKSKWKLECDALGDDDWRALAEMIRQLVGPFSSVEGVPRGGLKLAELLRPHAELAGPHLIVDDVLTSGGSMERLRERRRGENTFSSGYEGPEFAGAVVFARGQCPHWIKAIFQMPECFWLTPKVRGG